MNTPPKTVTPEIMPDEQKQIAAVVQQNALPQDMAVSLQSSFAPLFKEARELITQSRAVVVTDASQKVQIKLSREYRLALRQIRIKGEKTRKELKEAPLRTGKAIDAFNTLLLHSIGEEETRLEEQEKIVERTEQARKDALKATREAALKPYGTDTAFLALAEMPEETFAQLLENTRAGHEAKLAAARKAEEEKIAAENARLKEEARIREENEKLKREAESREAAAKIERERIAKEKAEAESAATKLKAEADAALAKQRAEAAAEAARIKSEADKAAQAAAEQARKEREAIEAKAKAERAEAERLAAEERAKVAKLEAEARARADAEKARVAAEQAAARAAASAPDKAKIAAFADAVRAITLPELSENNAALGKLLGEQRTKFADWIEAKSQTL